MEENKLKKMRTIILTITILVASFSVINAQKKATAGIKGGYNLSSVSFDGTSETEKLHGFHIGFYGESYLTNFLSIQPEILYSQQGYKIIDNGSTYTQELDYINIPLMFKLYPVKSLFFEAGPQIGFSISHKETFDTGFVLYNTSEEFEPRNFDWGLNFGAGFKSDSGVSLGVRHHLGQSDIYDRDKPKNRVWHIYVGFEF